MNLSQFIKNEINKQGKTLTWVANKLNLNYLTFYNRLEYDNLTGYDILSLSILLKFNLNEIKNRA